MVEPVKRVSQRPAGFDGSKWRASGTQLYLVQKLNIPNVDLEV